ncbi:hypothetical protein [uncultured Fibrobacter sp.]|uniref:hypothetical protein n=2 Tax=Fibrobacter TaxID=832 RepID=UPI0025D9986B|nr:hypothetical protein [uncultured Fibrobacter sp.]
MKLLQTYFTENNQIGSWNMVGYIAPNSGETTNFYYGTGVALNTNSQNATNVVGWAADNRVTLNNCPKGNDVNSANKVGATAAAHWQILVSVNTANAADVTFQSVAANTTTTAECLALTPSFESIK